MRLISHLAAGTNAAAAAADSTEARRFGAASTRHPLVTVQKLTAPTEVR
jgi:hypothetical protein